MDTSHNETCLMLINNNYFAIHNLKKCLDNLLCSKYYLVIKQECVKLSVS